MGDRCPVADIHCWASARWDTIRYEYEYEYESDYEYEHENTNTNTNTNTHTIAHLKLKNSVICRHSWLPRSMKSVSGKLILRANRYMMT